MAELTAAIIEISTMTKLSHGWSDFDKIWYRQTQNDTRWRM